MAICETVASDVSDIFDFALLVGEIFKSKMQKTSMSSASDFHAQIAY